MLEFNAENLEELEIEAAARAHEVSVEVTKGVIKALENNVDKVVIGVLATLDLDLSVDKEGYLEALETNLVRCEESEEFELCKTTDGIEILKWFFDCIISSSTSRNRYLLKLTETVSFNLLSKPCLVIRS